MILKHNDNIGCGECLCRVCARNVCTDNNNPDCKRADCAGCNDCTGIIELPEDCPRDDFLPDEEI